MEALLQVRGVARRFGAKQVLQGIDFSLRPGEVLGLLGPNGAGKTTCLQILAGTLAPSSGSVAIHGHDMVRAPRAAKRRLGYLPERPPIYPEMQVDDYLAHAAALHGLPTRDIAKAVQRVKRRCGLQQVGPRLLGKLSKGYRQRAGLAQALVHEPDLVILDEPTDGLDPVQIREVRMLIGDLGRSCGVIVSSHALSEVQAVCNRVVILRDGRVLHSGPLGERAPTRALRVRLRRPPAPPQIEGLPQVAAAVPDNTPDGGPGVFGIELAEGVGADQLAKALVGAGWGLLELTPARSDLERIFFESIGAEESGA
jgi:ABC-2 type transport system ATP-binding protein